MGRLLGKLLFEFIYGFIKNYIDKHLRSRIKNFDMYASIFILVFIGFIFLNGFGIFGTLYDGVKSFILTQTGKTFSAYKYENFPCKEKEFVLAHDMILLENKAPSLVDSFYGITRNTLEGYSAYLENEGIEYSLDSKNLKILNSKNKKHKEIKLYDDGEKFTVLGYFVHKSSFLPLNDIPAYLVKSHDGEIAWIVGNSFDFDKCAPAEEKVDALKHQEKIDKNYKSTKVEPKVPKAEFSSDDDTYAVSRVQYANYAKLLGLDVDEVFDEKSKQNIEFQNAVEKKDFSYLHKMMDKNISLFSDTVLDKLIDMDKNDARYMQMKALYNEVKYLKKHPNEKITSYSFNIDRKTGKESFSVTTSNESSWSELMLAIKSKNRNEIKRLLRAKPELKKVTNNGSNALLIAIYYKDLPTFKALLKMGMNVNSKNNFGTTALHMALIQNEYEMAKMLLEKGAKTDILDKQVAPVTAFMIETRKKTINYEMLDLLIAHGANVNRSTRNYPAPLLYSARNCNGILMTYLKKNGANEDLQDAFGKTYKEIYDENCPTF